MSPAIAPHPITGTGVQIGYVDPNGACRGEFIALEAEPEDEFDKAPV